MEGTLRGTPGLDQHALIGEDKIRQHRGVSPIFVAEITKVVKKKAPLRQAVFDINTETSNSRQKERVAGSADAYKNRQSI